MKTYTKGERQETIDRFISGESAADILADTGIPKSTFYNWVHIYQEEKKTLNKRTVNIRNFHLLENKIVRFFCVIAIPATEITLSSQKERYHFLLQCGIFDFSPSSSVEPNASKRSLSKPSLLSSIELVSSLVLKTAIKASNVRQLNFFLPVSMLL